MIHLRDRTLRLPQDASAFLGADHPHRDAVAEDLVRLAHHPGAGRLVLLGWGGREPITFQEEKGAHGGPGPEETSAFLMVPPETRAPADPSVRLRPQVLRSMALCALDQETCGKRSDITGRDRSPDQGISIRLMTYNVHGCRGMDGKLSPGRIARIIAREDPDVICLQELDVERTRSRGVDQIQVIAERLEADYHFHAVAELDDGRFGNAVISRHPLELLATTPLPAATRTKSMLNLEDRGALTVVLSMNGLEIRIVNTHLSILASERRLQTEALLGLQAVADPGSSGPLILAGDLNASPRSWTVRRLETRLRSVVDARHDQKQLRTWSGRTPLRRIDHVLVNDRVEVQNVYVPRTPLSQVASDHLPMVVDLVCYPASAVPEPEAELTPGSV
jgi:endonuclease/exonuclease/phosphatase family metal-dependent hydrolase